MKVLLIGNYVNDQQESMQRYVKMLGDLMPTSGIQLEILQPAPIFGRVKPSAHGIGKWLGYIDKYLIFPLVLKARLQREKKSAPLEKNAPSFLVHICDHSNAVYTYLLKGIPHLVTCHDLIAIQAAGGFIPGHHIKWTGRILQGWILAGLKRSRCIVCVSEKTRQDLVALLPQAESRSRVVRNTLNDAYSPMTPQEAGTVASTIPLEGFFRKSGLNSGPYLLHVGGNQWYKNREAVIRIFAQVIKDHPDQNLRLLMVGQPPTPAMLELVKSEGLQKFVFYATSVSSGQLRALYNLAHALIFPSWREGFGWPIIEAQACGCPVITSNLAPMNEIGGPAALYADPAQEKDFTTKVGQLLNEAPACREQRQRAAVAHASIFHPQPFIEKMVAAYQAVLQG